MHAAPIRGFWKVNSSRWIGEDQNSKHHQTGGEFTLFSPPGSPDLNAVQPHTWKWPLGPPKERAPGEALSHLSHERGRELLMLIESAESCSGDGGANTLREENLSLNGGAMRPRGRDNPSPQLPFSSFFILLLLGLGGKHNHRSMQQREVTNISAWWPKLSARELKRT